MNGLVVFESMFGNTEQVARAVADGLAEILEVAVCDVVEAPPGPDANVAIVVVGGPTHAFSMTRRRTRIDARRQGATQGDESTGIREWLSALPALKDHTPLATFDTKVVKPNLPGSAARAAAKQGRRRGYRVIAPPETFFVDGGQGPVTAGELKRAYAWGLSLAQQVRAESTERRPAAG